MYNPPSDSNGTHLNGMFYVYSKSCAGIGAARHANIVHRDLKPSNVFIVSVGGSTDSVVRHAEWPGTRRKMWSWSESVLG
jgi:serine/threonine protein kinase